MKYMIIWQDIPERTNIYFVDHTELTMSEVELNLCHNAYMNLQNTESVDAALEKLNVFLPNVAPIWRSDKEAGCFIPEKCTVIVTGIIL